MVNSEWSRGPPPTRYQGASATRTGRTSPEGRAEAGRSRTYEQLAERLKEHGFNEMKASIANKLVQATVSAHFFLAALAATGRESVILEDI